VDQGRQSVLALSYRVVFRVHTSPPCILDSHDYGHLGRSCQFWSDIVVCVLWEETGGGRRGTEERGLRSEVRGQSEKERAGSDGGKRKKPEDRAVRRSWLFVLRLSKLLDQSADS
jgi:hypothetical protein